MVHIRHIRAGMQLILTWCAAGGPIGVRSLSSRLTADYLLHLVCMSEHRRAKQDAVNSTRAKFVHPEGDHNTHICCH